jgi:hypothetical protein
MLGERVASIEVRRGGVAGVLLDGDTSPTGTAFVITDMTGEEIAALSGGQGISKRAQREWPRVIVSTRRFVVSLLVRRDAIPEALGREVLVLSDKPLEGAAHTIHLQRGVEVDGEVLLTAEVLRGERDPLTLTQMRGWVVRRLCRELPFLERHLVLVDSVHDGLPAWRYQTDGTSAVQPWEIERTELEGAAARAEPMDRQLDVDPPGYLGLGGEPVRGPIERTLLVGPSVLPGLGQEGALLAAWSAARLVTESDKRKARMRREMWTKMEIS